MPVPLVTTLILAVNVGVFALMALRGVPVMSPDTFSLQQWGGTYGPLLTAGQWWRLFTAMFVHAGLPHLLFNMVALLSIGSLIERMFGRVSCAVLYVLSGLVGSLVSVYWHPLAVGVGASGAIFGLYGGLFGFLAIGRRSLPAAQLSSLGGGAAVFVLYNIVFGALREDVDMAAHLGGLAAGVLAGMALARPGALVSEGVRARRGWVVGVVGVAMVALAATRLPQLDDWAGAVRTLGTLERRAFADVASSMEQVTGGRMQADAFADRLEQQVIAPWRQHRNRVAALRLPAKERALADKVVAYMDRRAAAWHLQAEAFRREDMSLMQQSNQEQEAANVAAREFLTAMGLEGTPVATPGRPGAAATGADAGERELAAAAATLAEVEKSTFQAYNDALAKTRAGELDETAFADLVDRRILGPLQAQQKRIAALHTSGPVEGQRKRLEQYLQLRVEAWRLTSRGLHNRSQQIMGEANAAHEKASKAFSGVPAK